MSDPRRICICGRKRGKEPVIITITTCRHNHPTKDGDLICISQPPGSTCSNDEGSQPASSEDQTSPKSEKEKKRKDSNKSEQVSFKANIEDSIISPTGDIKSQEEAKNQNAVTVDEINLTTAENDTSKETDMKIIYDQEISTLIKDESVDKGEDSIKSDQISFNANTEDSAFSSTGDSKSPEETKDQNAISVDETNISVDENVPSTINNETDMKSINDQEISTIKDESVDEHKDSDESDHVNTFKENTENSTDGESKSPEEIKDQNEITVDETNNLTADENDASTNNNETDLKSINDDLEIPTKDDDIIVENTNEPSLMAAQTNNETTNSENVLVQPEETEEEHDNKDEEDEATVMYVTETAVNTLPLFDTLFWPKYDATKPSATIPQKQEQNDCAMEIFIFEKHSKKCRYFSSEGKTQNLFFDGDGAFETVGKISFPLNCDELHKTKSDRGGIVPYPKTNLTANSTKCRNSFDRTFEALETYLKNKQFFESSPRVPGPFKIDLEKYITMGDNIYSRKYTNNPKDKDDIKELYVRKTFTERSVQFEGLSTKEPIQRKKWYDIFLICFGFKDAEEVYYSDSICESEQKSKDSPNLITNYLKI